MDFQFYQTHHIEAQVEAQRKELQQESEQKFATLLRTRVEDVFKIRPYAVQYFKAFVLMLAMIVLLSIVSVLSGITYVADKLYSMMSNWYVCMGLATMGLLLWQGLQHVLVSKTIRKYHQFRKAQWSNILVISLMVFANVWVSYYGAASLPYLMAEKPKLIDVEGKKRYYDSQIEDAKIRLNSYNSRNSVTEKGKEKLRYNANKGYAQIQGEITQLQEARESQIALAEQKNEEMLSEHQSKTRFDGESVAGFVLILELILLALEMGVERYYKKSAEEWSILSDNLPSNLSNKQHKASNKLSEKEDILLQKTEVLPTNDRQTLTETRLQPDFSQIQPSSTQSEPSFQQISETVELYDSAIRNFKLSISHWENKLSGAKSAEAKANYEQKIEEIKQKIEHYTEKKRLLLVKTQAT